MSSSRGSNLQWQVGSLPLAPPGKPSSLLLLLLLPSHFSRAHQAPPIPGILQARTLEWVAISFSNAGKWRVKVKSLSHVRLFTTLWTAAYQAPLSMGFSRQEYRSGVPCLLTRIKSLQLHVQNVYSWALDLLNQDFSGWHLGISNFSNIYFCLCVHCLNTHKIHHCHRF